MGNILALDRGHEAEESLCIDLTLLRQLSRIVESCSQAPHLALVRAPAGAGKTYALRHAIADGTDLAVLVTLNPACGSLCTGTAAILDALLAHPVYRRYGGPRPVSWHKGTSGPNMHRIREILDIAAACFDRPPVLIVDEAHWACRSLLETCRYLYDQGLCSLIVVGNDAFVVDGLEPLVSRAHFEIDQKAVSEADIEAFCRHHGITAAEAQAVVGRVAAARGIRGAEELLRRARAAGGEGGLRHAVLRDVARTMSFASAPPAPAGGRRARR